MVETKEEKVISLTAESPFSGIGVVRKGVVVWRLLGLSRDFNLSPF